VNRAILAWITALAGAGPATPTAAAAPCAPDADLSYVCGLERPEDVVRIPGTPWLIVSGFAPGAGLHFLDTRDGAVRSAYQRLPAQLAPDPGLPPQCPGPVDPALFNTRGLSLRTVGPDLWQLLVVNHGERESIEVFDLSLEAQIPRIRWRGCIPMPQGQVANSVASFADGTMLATVLTRPGTTIADFVAGRVTGAVWQWKKGMTGFEVMPGTELPGNNGIEVDPDGRHYYVVAFGWHAVAIFDRTRGNGPVEVVTAPDFMPDNIHWSAGRLLLAGMRHDEPACGGTRKVIDGVADPMLCHRGWVVGELDLRQHRIATVAHGPPQPQFNGISAAALVSGALWLGSFQADRVGVARIP
jgi:hypothetical protein